MRRISTLGLLLVAATATGCVYPALKSGAGGAHASAGSQAVGGSHAGDGAAGATGSGGKGGSAAGATASSSHGGSAAGAAGSSGRGGSGGGNDAGVSDGPGTQPDVPIGGTGSGGTGTGGSTDTGGNGGGGGSSTAPGPNCPSLTDPANGSVSAAGTAPNSTATYSCNPGYKPSGTMTRTCQTNGTWNGTAPTCTIVDCGALKNPTNGTVVASPTTYGSKADYTCQTGFGLAGTSPRICQADGTWSGTAPTCGAADCPAPPTISNGAPTTTGTTFGSTATYACNPGYNLSGTAVHTCQADRTWSGTLPACTVVDCGSPSIGSGTYSPAATTYGSTVKFTCNDCYSLAGASTRTCQANGTWSGLQPTCTLVDCGPPPTIANGKASLNGGTNCGWSAMYSCSPGYSLSTTTKMSTCQADGTWSTPLPTCSLQTFDLTVSKGGSGTGKAISSDNKISCGNTCVASYPYGTIVTLMATPDANQSFTGWIGEGCTGLGACSFTLTSATTVTANFSQPPNIMFTTSTLQTAASLGGLAGADALCMKLAGNAKLPGHYVAWLSTDTVSAASRLGSASGWVRTDGKPFLNSMRDLTYYEIFYPPRLDENGHDLGRDIDPLAPDILVVTNTGVGGGIPTWAGVGTCNRFTSDDGSRVEMGSATHNGPAFTEANNISCSVPARLYCFGIDYQAQVSVTPAVGRRAFMSVAQWIPGGGIAAADALCQSEASTAKLPGTYKALLAPTGATAASRFAYGPSTLPWVRSDGILVASTANAFFTTTLFDASPNISADGLVYGINGVWSGAATPMTAGTDATNCSNWLSSSPNQIGTAGLATNSLTTSVQGGFFNEYPSSNPCSATWMNLVCLQE